MTTLVAVAIDASIVIAAALLVCAVLRGRSAAARHAILTAAIAAVLFVPALELLLPQLPVFQRIEMAEAVAVTATRLTAAPASSIDEASHVAGADVPWAGLAIAIWLAGALVITAGLAAGWVRLVRVRARCTPATSPWPQQTARLARAHGIRREVAVLQSEDPSLLVTCGVLRPSIILPAGVEAWPADRVGHVLAHELAHIRRHDVAIQAAAEMLRALFWINPLVWMACRRLRQESELACDDAVLRAGVAGEDYASDLLDIAKQLSPRTMWSSAPAIAHPSTLERRIAAMLQRNRNRAPLGAPGWIAAAGLIFAIAVPVVAAGSAPDAVVEIAAPQQRLAAAHVVVAREVAPMEPPAPVQQVGPPLPPRIVVTPAARPPAYVLAQRDARNGSIRIQVLDQTGGVIPGAKVTFTDTETGKTMLLTTGVTGASISELAGGRYEIAVSLPGFTTVYDRITLAAGGQLERRIVLPVGTMTESIHVSCGGQYILQTVAVAARRTLYVAMPVVSAQQPAPPPKAPVRVGGSIRAPLKQRDAKPVCPSDLPADVKIQLSGRLGTDGRIHDLAPQPAATGADPVEKAVDAVRAAVSQWVYTPARLNNVPVDVNVTVVVTFTKR